MNLQAILEAPTEFDFYQAVYQFQLQLSHQDKGYRVGHDAIPSEELIRFKSDQHLGFPGQAISKIDAKLSQRTGKQAAEMHVSFMGMTGPSGVLPQHYTELVLERLRLKDTGMRDFYDLFNHRLISLFYRAWEKYRFAVNYDSSQKSTSDSFSHVLNQLSGGGTHSRYYSGFSQRKSPSAESLRLMLEDFTGCIVEIKSFEGRWQSLANTEQTRMVSRAMPEGQYAQLGKDASIGSKVWDINSSITINIKPSKKGSVASFLPGEPGYLPLKELVDKYLGKSVKHKVYLEIKQQDAPKAQLSMSAVPLGLGCGLLSRADNGQQLKRLMI